jgi:hypothetical protein
MKGTGVERRRTPTVKYVKHFWKIVTKKLGS